VLGSVAAVQIPRVNLANYYHFNREIILCPRMAWQYHGYGPKQADNAIPFVIRGIAAPSVGRTFVIGL